MICREENVKYAWGKLCCREPFVSSNRVLVLQRWWSSLAANGRWSRKIHIYHLTVRARRVTQAQFMSV